MDTENQFLGTERIGKLMSKYAIPCIISLLVGALYNIVDQLFIANASYLGSYGNAANTVVFPLTVVALGIAVFIGDGCCAFVSIALGRNACEDAHRSASNAVVLCVVSSLVLTAIYLIFNEPILAMFGGTVNEETHAFAKEYFFYITLGVPFYMFGQAMNPVIRSDGSPKFAMIATVSGAITNVILDPIFIYGFRWGMMGAAVATVIGQVLTAALSIWYLRRMKVVKLEKSSFRLDWKLIPKFLVLGLTSFLAQISLVISMAAVQNMCMKYGAKDPIFGQPEYAQIPLAVRIAELTEDLEELRSEKALLLQKFEYAEDAGTETFRKDIAIMEAGLKKLEAQEQKYSAELDKALDEYAELKVQAADFDPVELYEARQVIRPVQEKAAEQQLADTMHEKPSLVMLLSAKQEASRLLGEGSDEQLAKQFIIQHRKERQNAIKKRGDLLR